MENTTYNTIREFAEFQLWCMETHNKPSNPLALKEYILSKEYIFKHFMPTNERKEQKSIDIPDSL